MSRSLTCAELAAREGQRWPDAGCDAGGSACPPGQSPGQPPDKLIKALEAHVETLRAQLAAAEARIGKQADDLVAYDAAYAAGLSAERAKVEAERAKADQALAAAESRAEKQASDFAAREAQQAAPLCA